MKAAAKDRLLAMVSPALAELQRIMTNKKTSDGDKLRAIQMVLDRTGFKPGVQIDVSLSKFDEIALEAFGMVEGASLDRALPSPDPTGSEDLEQHGYDAQQDAWREFTEEDAPVRIDRHAPNTVQGEVVAQHDDHGPFPPPAPMGPSEHDPK